MSVFDRLRAAVAGGADRLSPSDFLARLQPDDVILDVRTPAEFAAGHVEGAVLMDVAGSNFRERAARLDPTKTYFLYCMSGARSGQAASFLRGVGIDNAFNVGGIEALARAGAAITR